MKALKGLKGHRTRLFNLTYGSPALMEFAGQVLNLPEMQGVLPAKWLPWYVLAGALANILLRQFTTTPPGKKS